MTFRPLDILMGYSNSGNPEVRANAAAALGAMDNPRARQRVMDLLGDADERVRDSAFHAFSQFADGQSFFERLSASRRIRRQSVGLLARRSPGPSLAGAMSASILGLIAYLVLTLLVDREVEGFVATALGFAMISVLVACLCAVVGAVSARPIAHYKDTLTGLLVELSSTSVISAIVAILGSALFVISASDTGASQTEESGSGWHFLILSDGVIAVALAGRLGAGLAARAMPLASFRGLLAGLAAFAAAWFVFSMFLLGWARTSGDADLVTNQMLGRFVLAGLVAVGAYAATLGHVESAGLRQRLPARRPIISAAAATALSIPGLFGLTSLGLNLGNEATVIAVSDLTTEIAFSAPQQVKFDLPLSADILVEIPPSAASSADPVLPLREDYGAPPASRSRLRELLEGEIGPGSAFSWSDTEQGIDFWSAEDDRYDDDKPLSLEARRIVNYWLRLPDSAYDDDDEEIDDAIADSPLREWANRPAKMAEIASSLRLEILGEGFSETWQDSWGTEGRLSRGEATACIFPGQSSMVCEDSLNFESFFELLGYRALQSWPLIGSKPVKGTLRLTVLTDRDAMAFDAAQRARQELLDLSIDEQPEAGKHLVIALRDGSWQEKTFFPGEVLHWFQPEDGQATSEQSSEEPVTDWIFWQRRSASASSTKLKPGEDVAIIPITDKTDRIAIISQALALSSAFEASAIDALGEEARRELIRAADGGDRPSKTEYVMILSASNADASGVIYCPQNGLSVVVLGGPGFVDELTPEFEDATYLSLGQTWNEAWPAVYKTIKGEAPQLAPKHDQCGARDLPGQSPELSKYLGTTLPDSFDVDDARNALAGKTDAVDRTMVWSSTKQGREFWSEQNAQVNAGNPLSPEARDALLYWISLAPNAAKK